MVMGALPLGLMVAAVVIAAAQKEKDSFGNSERLGKKFLDYYG